jgi:hypothetical protein
MMSWLPGQEAKKPADAPKSSDGTQTTIKQAVNA